MSAAVVVIAAVFMASKHVFHVCNNVLGFRVYDKKLEVVVRG